MFGSPWLPGAAADRGGLLLPRGTPASTADLLLRSGAALVQAGGHEVELPWSAFPTGWTVEVLVRLGRYRVANGSCIVVRRTLRGADLEAVRSSVAGTLDPLHRHLHELDPDCIPLDRTSAASRSDFLRNLCRRFATSEGLRSKLDDPAWVETVAAALRAPRWRPPWDLLERLRLEGG